MLRPSAVKIARALCLSAAVLATVVVVLYMLAQMALNDLERTETSPPYANVSSVIGLTVKADGSPAVVGADRIDALPGHGGALASAHVVGNGGALLTTSVDGTVRLTRLDALRRLDAAASGMGGAVHNRVWLPYGASWAQWSLWVVSQVAPLHIPETQRGRRGRAFRDCAECPEMIEIHGGLVFWGAPLTEGWRPHMRELSRVPERLAVGRFAVTFDEWDACVEAGVEAGGCAHRPDDRGWGRGLRPVIGVSWDDAKAYIKWLSGRTGKSYRLLSELQREYVARAGTTTAYWWGSSIGAGAANCDGCGSGWSKQTAPVGSFKANAFGLHDTSGNVWEWTEDCASPAQDGAKECPSRVLRGGSWMSRPYELRSSHWRSAASGERIPDAGFRVARTLDGG